MTKMNPKEAWLDDPALFEKSKMYIQTVGTQKYRSRRTEERKVSAQKGVQTRRRNQSIKHQVAEQIKREQEAEIAFLPIEFRDPSRKISLSDLIKLTRKHPDKAAIIERLHQERKAGKIRLKEEE